jgi:hypothetical protein
VIYLYTRSPENVQKETTKVPAQERERKLVCFGPDLVRPSPGLISLVPSLLVSALLAALGSASSWLYLSEIPSRVPPLGLSASIAKQDRPANTQVFLALLLLSNARQTWWRNSTSIADSSGVP